MPLISPYYISQGKVDRVDSYEVPLLDHFVDK